MHTSEIWLRDSRLVMDRHGEESLEWVDSCALAAEKWQQNETQTEQAEVAGGQQKMKDKKWWHLAPETWYAPSTPYNPFTIVMLTSIWSTNPAINHQNLGTDSYSWGYLQKPVNNVVGPPLNHTEAGPRKSSPAGSAFSCFRSLMVPPKIIREHCTSMAGHCGAWEASV